MSPPDDLPNDPVTAQLRGTTALIERLIALAAFVALVVGVWLVLRPFVTGILFGTILVVATWPFREWLIRRGVPNGLAAMLLLGAALATIVAPTVSLAPGLADRLVDGFQRAQAYFASSPELPGWLASIPFVKESLTDLWNDLADPSSAFQTFIQPYSAELRRILVAVAQAFAEGIFQLFVALAVAVMFWLRGEAIAGIVRDIAERIGGGAATAALNAASDSVRGIAYGIVGTAAVQAILMTIGLMIARVPGAGLLGFLTLIIALSQFGILLVFIFGGAAWWLFTGGHTALGVFMIVWGIMVSTIDNFIRPWLVSFGAAMPLTLIVLGVFGGFLAFGFLGLFIGPTLLGVFYNLLQAWRAMPARPELPAAESGRAP